jgi:cytochrome bd-type quinol oxidase subunit 1
VAGSLAAFALVYTFLAVLFFIFARRIIARGPDPKSEDAGSYAKPGKG